MHLPTDDEISWDELASDLGIAPAATPVEHAVETSPALTADNMQQVEFVEEVEEEVEEEVFEEVAETVEEPEYIEDEDGFGAEETAGEEVILETDSGAHLSIHVPEEYADSESSEDDSDEEGEESASESSDTTTAEAGGKKRRRRRRRRKGGSAKESDATLEEVVSEEGEEDSAESTDEVAVSEEPSNPFDTASEDDEEMTIQSAMDEEIQSQLDSTVIEWGEVVPWTELVESLYRPDR